MRPGVVLDTNVVLEWLLRERPTPVGEAATALLPTADLFGPRQLWSEATTGILKREREGALTAEQRVEALATLDALHIRYDPFVDGDQQTLLLLASTHRLTIYDALFLEVVLRRRSSLATNDSALRRAAEAEGVPLV